MTIEQAFIIPACLLLFACMAWKEVTRSNRRRLAWRLLASAVSAASLACLILPVAFKARQLKSQLTEAVLLTEGFNRDSLQRFLKSEGENIPVYTIDKNLSPPGTAYNSMLTDVDFFEVGKRQYRNMHVFGYGFDKEILKTLNGQAIIFHPSAMPAGTQSVSWTNKINAGQQFQVQGTFHNTSRQAAKIILSGLHTSLDSALVPPGKKQDFQLRAMPKHIDRAVYSLLVLSGKDTVEHEELPVEVLNVKPLRLLILAASPDFENKFLKNWLSANAYQVLVRTNISQDKYEKEYLNMPAISFDKLTPSMLEKFDMVISDAEELTRINNRELNSIRSLVNQGRLGLIVKADSAISKNAFYSRQFPVYHSTGSTGKSVPLQWANMPGEKPLLNTENFVFIRYLPGTQPIISDNLSRIMVNSSLYGSGKIALTTLDNTYSWLLAGKDASYHALWSLIINNAVKRSPSNIKWSVSPALPGPDEAVELNLQTGINEGVPLPAIQQNAVFLQQNFRLPFEWSGKFWPSQKGWQSITQENEPPYWWYVFGGNAWKSLRALKKIEHTMEYAASHQFKDLEITPSAPLVTKQVPKFYFFCMFILCCSFLWIEKKYAAFQ